MSLSESINQAKRLLQTAQHAVALTGAGVSTPSGIPDFRSPGSGVWATVDPFRVASISAFRRQPQAFYDWIRPMIHLVEHAQPNPAHVALAKLEAMGLVRALITQNIDGLHHRAGSKRVIEVHGNFRSATCIDCYQETPGDLVLKHALNCPDVPACEKCGGVLKPNVILFGEQLPYAAVQDALHQARQCDLMLVTGSSLTVEPASRIPELAQQQGARLLIINLQPTHLDPLADVVIHADVAQVLPQIADDSGRNL